MKEREPDGAGWRWKHERLRKARRGLEKLCRSGELFTFLDPELAQEAGQSRRRTTE